MIEHLVPAGVAAASLAGDGHDVDIDTREVAGLGPAGDRRRADFLRGRACARRAIAALGLTPEPVLIGEDRGPIWPAGVVGSITHCDGYAAAAVALADHVRAIGIDVEAHRRLSDGAARKVCSPQELEWAAAATRDIAWPTVLFSIRESVYKAWRPMTCRWLGYRDVDVHRGRDVRRNARRSRRDRAGLAPVVRGAVHDERGVRFVRGCGRKRTK
jgi:4'-phosphopantetheinyl transferase EntD